MYPIVGMMVVLLAKIVNTEQQNFLNTNLMNFSFDILNRYFHFKIQTIQRKKVNTVIMELST